MIEALVIDPDPDRKEQTIHSSTNEVNSRPTVAQTNSRLINSIDKKVWGFCKAVTNEMHELSQNVQR